MLIVTNSVCFNIPSNYIHYDNKVAKKGFIGSFILEDSN
jgi:hypothetical protein